MGKRIEIIVMLELGMKAGLFETPALIDEDKISMIHPLKTKEGEPPKTALYITNISTALIVPKDYSLLKDYLEQKQYESRTLLEYEKFVDDITRKGGQPSTQEKEMYDYLLNKKRMYGLTDNEALLVKEYERLWVK